MDTRPHDLDSSGRPEGLTDQLSQPTRLEALRALSTLSALVARYDEFDGIPNTSQPAVQAAPTTAGAPTLNLQPGEHYAGVILDAQGRAQHHLVLMAAEPAGELRWKDAVAWAESVGGVLPTRKEQALLFANCGEQFKADWYWSGEQYSADYAWSQGFNLGLQYDGRKSAELRARAVRRFAA